jgi:cysteine desulfurase
LYVKISTNRQHFFNEHREFQQAGYFEGYGVMPVYLDCNATTPVDPRVRDEVVRFMDLEFGNAGSRTHQFGQRAKQAVQRAREQIAALVDAATEEVIFTSGATESDNLSILGLRAFGERTGRRHIVSTAIEHKAVLEPLACLASQGFDVTLVPPSQGGSIEPDVLRGALRPTKRA